MVLPSREKVGCRLLRNGHPCNFYGEKRNYRRHVDTIHPEENGLLNTALTECMQLQPQPYDGQMMSRCSVRGCCAAAWRLRPDTHSVDTLFGPGDGQRYLHEIHNVNWAQFCQLPSGKLPKRSFICSRHFLPDDYVQKKTVRQHATLLKPRLLWTANPTQNPPDAFRFHPGVPEKPEVREPVSTDRGRPRKTQDSPVRGDSVEGEDIALSFRAFHPRWSALPPKFRELYWSYAKDEEEMGPNERARLVEQAIKEYDERMEIDRILKEDAAATARVERKRQKTSSQNSPALSDGKSADVRVVPRHGDIVGRRSDDSDLMANGPWLARRPSLSEMETDLAKQSSSQTAATMAVRKSGIKNIPTRKWQLEVLSVKHSSSAENVKSKTEIVSGCSGKDWRLMSVVPSDQEKCTDGDDPMDPASDAPDGSMVTMFPFVQVVDQAPNSADMDTGCVRSSPNVNGVAAPAAERKPAKRRRIVVKNTSGEDVVLYVSNHIPIQPALTQASTTAVNSVTNHVADERIISTANLPIAALNRPASDARTITIGRPGSESPGQLSSNVSRTFIIEGIMSPTSRPTQQGRPAATQVNHEPSRHKPEDPELVRHQLELQRLGKQLAESNTQLVRWQRTLARQSSLLGQSQSSTDNPRDPPGDMNQLSSDESDSDLEAPQELLPQEYSYAATLGTRAALPEAREEADSEFLRVSRLASQLRVSGLRDLLAARRARTRLLELRLRSRLSRQRRHRRLSALLSDAQISVLDGAKPSQWPQRDIRRATELRAACGDQGYRFLREKWKMPLPPLRSLPPVGVGVASVYEPHRESAADVVKVDPAGIEVGEATTVKVEAGAD